MLTFSYYNPFLAVIIKRFDRKAQASIVNARDSVQIISDSNLKDQVLDEAELVRLSSTGHNTPK